MTGKRPPPRSSGPTGNDAKRAAVAARQSNECFPNVSDDYLATPKTPSPILRRSQAFNHLVVQLSIDPAVRSVRFLDSLPVLGGRIKVRVEMLVAELDNERVAYDLVDDRPVRDLDDEGLVLLGLEEAGITLIEVDRMQLQEEPKSGNCLRIWRNRSHPVDDLTKANIIQALKEEGAVTIRRLGEIAVVSSPFRVACALAWKGVVAVDLSQPFELDSEVTLIDRPFPTSRQQPFSRGRGDKKNLATKSRRSVSEAFHPDLWWRALLPRLPRRRG